MHLPSVTKLTSRVWGPGLVTGDRVCVHVHGDPIFREHHMPVIPKDKVGKIEFCENHTTPWAANAVAIGTSSSAVTDLTTKTTAARDAYNAQQAAQNAAKAATNTLKMAVDAMASAAQGIIDQVRVKAATAGNS